MMHTTLLASWQAVASSSGVQTRKPASGLACGCFRSQTRLSFRQHVSIHQLRLPTNAQRCRLDAAASKASAPTASASSSSAPPVSAEEAVNRGLKVLEGQKYNDAAVAEALDLFQTAMQLQPSRAEARAALFNAGCCHAKRKEWDRAIDCIEEAINEQGLKFQLALEDKDLAGLRERREWMDAVGRLRGSVSNATLQQLRTEAKAPFRLTRIIFGSGLLAGAAIGLVIILSRLVAALQGGEGAPDLTETLRNLGINGAAVAALGFIVQRDLSSEARDKRIVEREESLGRLQVSVSGDRVLPLAAFRGTTRPVLLVGSRAWLAKAVAAAEPQRRALRERGVSLIQIPSAAAEADDPTERLRALKREFQGSNSSAKGFGKQKDSSKASKAPAAGRASKEDQKWQLEPYDLPEWLQWVTEQLQSANLAESGNVYVQVSLDGTVRSSGVGIPPWDRFLGDLAPMDDVRTKLTRQ